MGFDLTARDRQRLEGVHPDLVAVVERASYDSSIPFVVLEGVRTQARQRELVARGSSQTMNSRHIPAENGWGHAVDLAPIDHEGKASWDWPLYHRLAPIIKRAANDEGIPLEWGGDWKSFKDGPHWQLPWKQYPGTVSAQRTAVDDQPTDWPEEYRAEAPPPMVTKKEAAAGGGGFLAGVSLGPLLNVYVIIAIVVLIIFLAFFLGRDTVREYFNARVKQITGR